MKIDPYKRKEAFQKWKEKTKERIPEISKTNSDIVKRFLSDMETGINISGNKKGSRSYARLLSLKNRLITFCKKIGEFSGIQDISSMTEEQAHSFFAAVRGGQVKRSDGKEYQDTGDFVKDFKVFWHWHMKVSKKSGKEIKDITTDLDLSKEKPIWVYLDESQVRRLADSAKYEYKVLIWFLFDSGIRSPTELVNIRVSDFQDNFKKLNIRDEVSKTFGRTIKLLLCPDVIRPFVKDKSLSGNDIVFSINPTVANRYLKRLAKRLFGEEESMAGEKYSQLTLYDFRHCSCCYWLPRYKSESGLKYRFGWKKSDKIHYYSELLGMKDTIAEEDLLIDVTKTQIEKELIESRRENKILTERVDILENQMAEIQVLATKLRGKLK